MDFLSLGRVDKTISGRLDGALVRMSGQGTATAPHHIQTPKGNGLQPIGNLLMNLLPTGPWLGIHLPSHRPRAKLVKGPVPTITTLPAFTPSWAGEKAGAVEANYPTPFLLPPVHLAQHHKSTDQTQPVLISSVKRKGDVETQKPGGGDEKDT